ncbi:MAG: hypothetical protein E7255_02810 [Lachnospiraceae bacterium]|jgi:hypothetical protein|nr:hypothetical protein [Lachnospiraceae bacterium]
MSKIPHRIHYCWFGEGEKPEIVKECIASWQKYMPDWEIIEWNEKNYDLRKNNFMKKAYACKKWAFVSDYARFDILNQYGGIYFDTDVEMLKELPKEILEYAAFSGVEWAGKVSPGLVFGCEKNFPLLNEILAIYNKAVFDAKKLKTVNELVTDILLKKGFVKDNSFQVIEGLAVFPKEIFCGYNTDIREPAIVPETIAYHHYLGSWVKPALKVKLQDRLKKRIGVQRYSQLLFLKRRITKCFR